MNISKIKTLAQLKASGYISKSIKQELRDNLIIKLQQKKPVFQGIVGFEDTVIPDLERAILSRHNILLLGLRGQAKTRIARQLTHLLDEYMPIIEGSEINDDPLSPISLYGINLVNEMKDQTPIQWVHRSERYVEKLATPDVSIADLIGDVDPIKAATLKLPYSDQRVIHFGLVPRAHRCIFVINELPDLQARIQVSLFNTLQEGDLQIRGFKLRLPLDLQFVFTANPEDYTNRGSIVTPLKDRIESQILTHYPRSIQISKEITQQEAKITEEQKAKIYVPDPIKDLLELIAFNARESEYIDEKSGVSARLSISAYENLISTAERRMIINGEEKTTARITDLWGVIPAITGKVELVYEGEQEGPYGVALKLISSAIKDQFLEFCPNPEYDSDDVDPYGAVKLYFEQGHSLELYNDDSNETFNTKIESISGLKKLAQKITKDENEISFYMELLLNGLVESQILSKSLVDSKHFYKDPLADMMDNLDDY